MDSIWGKDMQLPGFSRLEGDLRTQVLVIGGGMAGLLCAKRLTDSGVDCTLIEENRIMGGVSGRTTAKVTSQHGLRYHSLRKRFGAEKAWRYWRAHEDALEEMGKLAKDAQCHWERQSNYVYATRDLKSLETEMDACTQLKIPARWKTSLPLPFSVAGAVEFPDQAQLHPLKLAAHITKGLKIYENTKAMSFINHQVQTPKGNITAKKIIVATHFPLLNKHGAYFLKLYQQRSYVIALEHAPQPEGMYLDCAEGGLSLRTAGAYLLLGGGGHRTGKQGLGWRLPEAAAKKYYPEASVVTRWATQDCMSLDGMPYIGRYSKATPNLYVATGFGKWGMTGSMLSAMILADLVRGREDPYGELFSPARSIWHKQLLQNGMETTANLLRPTGPRCPHLGCALHWNAAEHSWDCACHGSRFDEKGKLLNHPATDDMKHPPR